MRKPITRIISIIISVLFLVGTLTAATFGASAATGVTVSLTSEKETCYAGETMKISISIAGAAVNNIGAMKFTFNYDKSLEPEIFFAPSLDKNVLVEEKGPVCPQGADNTFVDSGDGKVEALFVMGSGGNIIADGVFATFNFKVPSNAIVGDTFVFSVNNDLDIVGNNNNALAATTGTNLTITVVPEIIGLRGNITMSGTVGAADILAMKKHLLNITLLTGDALLLAKITNGSTVGAADLLAIKKHILNIELIKVKYSEYVYRT